MKSDCAICFSASRKRATNNNGCRRVKPEKKELMETLVKILEKVLKMPGMAALGFCFVLACSTVKEQGEPDAIATPGGVITNDVQRQAIYERGFENTIWQNTNPIPGSDQLQLNEKASETNRKQNIEEGSNPNAPSNTPTEERPRQIRNVGNDTIMR